MEQTSFGPRPALPTLASFDNGLDGSSTSDNNIAAGPDSLVAMRNSRFEVMTKTGTITFGPVNNNSIFAGTNTIEQVALTDLVDSLERQGLRKMVLLNGHGGNELKPLTRELHHRTRVFLCVCDWFRMVTDLYGRLFEQPGVEPLADRVQIVRPPVPVLHELHAPVGRRRRQLGHAHP